MKASELLKLVGQMVKLRPAVRRVLPDGHELPSIDDDWRVKRSSTRRAVIRIHNLATGHVVDLGSDNVYEFRTPNLFVLKEQLTLTA